jgi:hypothetical protein
LPRNIVVTFLDLVVLILAVFRISRLVIEDTITQPVRDWLLGRWPGRHVEYDPGDQVRGGTVSIGGELYAAEPTWVGDRIAKLISCYWCTGFWVALALVVAYAAWPKPTLWVAFPFAVAAGAGIVGVLMHEAVED